MQLMYIRHPKYGYLYDFVRDTKETIPDVLEKKEKRHEYYSNDNNVFLMQERVRDTN